MEDSDLDSVEALNRWRSLVFNLNSVRRRFRNVADLAIRADAEKKKRNILKKLRAAIYVEKAALQFDAILAEKRNNQKKLRTAIYVEKAALRFGAILAEEHNKQKEIRLALYIEAAPQFGTVHAEERKNQGSKFLSVFFLVLEAISVVLDIYGNGEKNFLLPAILLSAFGSIITMWAFIIKEFTAAFKQKAERELAWVEVVFCLSQLFTLFIQYILAVAKVKNSCNPSIFPLVFAFVHVVFAFKKEKTVNNHDPIWYRQVCKFLSVFFLVLEAISMLLDLYGKTKKNFLLAAFLLSAFGSIITICAFIIKIFTAAFKRKAERELAWVEVVFSVSQLLTFFIKYILAVEGVKRSNDVSLFPLVFACVHVVFAFKEKTVNNHDRISYSQWGTPLGSEANLLLQPVRTCQQPSGK